VRPAHREIRAGFVQKHEASRIYSADPAPERRPLGLDRRTIVFRGACAFFEDVSGPLQRSQNARPMHARARGRFAIVCARQLVGRPVGFLVDQLLE
jgi:hypothetical protein